MTTTTAFILGLLIAFVLFIVVPCLIGLAIRWLAWDDFTPELDASGDCWGRWSEVVCPECGKHICGQETTATEHPTHIFELCQQCQRSQSPAPAAGSPSYCSDRSHSSDLSDSSHRRTVAPSHH